MKKLLLTISFLTLLSSALMAKTETITEEVCKSPSGCRIEMTTGECIGCVIITRTIVKYMIQLNYQRIQIIVCSFIITFLMVK